MDKLNILYAGNMHLPWASEVSVARELERQGHKVTRFVYPTLFGTNYPEVNKQLFNELKNKKYDLMIGSKCMGLFESELKQIKVPKVSWVFDLFKGYVQWNRFEWYEKQFPHWDLCFGAEAGQKEYYEEKFGKKYYPLKCGADPEYHRKMPYDPEFESHRCDISFLGGLYNPLRVNMWSAIRTIPLTTPKNFVGYEIKTITTPGIYMENISKLANVCKISIGCNYRNDIEGYWSKRPYELMGSNLFMIQAFVNGMEQDGFKDKVNTVFFHDDNFEEMAELIKYYLLPENEEERNKIREKGYHLIHSKHMMKNRIKVFFDTINKEELI